MRYTRAIAVAVAAFMLVMPMAYLVSAKTTGHDEGAPIMITKPQVDGAPISCAVYFADNMVFAPQWRVGNLVRIEMMIINMTDLDDPQDIENSTINLPIDWYLGDDYLEKFVIYDDGVPIGTDQQKYLLDASKNIGNTSMVSVSHINVTITGVSGEALGYTMDAKASWESEAPYTQIDSVGGLGREVNKHGNLIYGMLWDTANEENPAPKGEYEVNVQLGDWYTVDFAVGHLYVGDGALLDDEYPYVSLVSSPDEDPTIEYPEGSGEFLCLYADLGIGFGGVSMNTAWILLGPLIPQGPGGGNGGDGGEGGGNDGELGGNCLGNLGHNRAR